MSLRSLESSFLTSGTSGIKLKLILTIEPTFPSWSLCTSFWSSISWKTGLLDRSSLWNRSQTIMMATKKSKKQKDKICQNRCQYKADLPSQADAAKPKHQKHFKYKNKYKDKYPTSKNLSLKWSTARQTTYQHKAKSFKVYKNSSKSSERLWLQIWASINSQKSLKQHKISGLSNFLNWLKSIP